MNDVARTAGVSLKTVSRVVNGETTVDPTLAARVRAAVAALNYRRHLGASMLRRMDRRTGTIGLLIDDVGNPFSAALLRAVEDAARARGVHVLAGSLDGDPDRERELVRAFARRHADGLILAPAGPDQGYLAAELPPDVPVVFLERPATGFAADAVLTGDAAGALRAVRHLIGYGHRHIAYLGDPATRERRQGYLAALGALGLRPVMVDGLRGSPAAEAATRSLLGRPRPPTALFTGRNLITIGAVRALRGLGRHLDAALVGFDDFLLADLLEPAITVVAQDPAAMGEAAARALFERIDGYAEEPREISVATTLIPRGSGEVPPTGS
ncbi:LacI family DNA-binding transcriptional regulator [Actinoplanes sp. NPDC049668]|uniref:LacI family DNA-binding transcriptional regulator n=1 Tax=unclassified Actinoplanes TaxID=2626549 RepID=UPI0033AF3765